MKRLQAQHYELEKLMNYTFYQELHDILVIMKIINLNFLCSCKGFDIFLFCIAIAPWELIFMTDTDVT